MSIKMKPITLDSLIEEQTMRIPTLKYKPSPPNVIGGGYYYYEDGAAYHRWIATTKRVISTLFPGDKDIIEFENISKEGLSPTQQNKLLALLEAFQNVPTVVTDNRITQTEKKGKGKDAVNVITTINNSQSQAQTQSIEIFLDAIKDDLTGKQVKDLKQIVSEADGDLQKAKPKIIDRIKAFGLDVSASIIANLITNPTIWRGM